MPSLYPRFDDECYYSNGYRYCRNSAWNDWVRWVVLAVIVVGFFLLFVACSCFTARRRRKAGQQPFYGTGWAARPQNAQPYYSQPAPPYTQNPAPGQHYYGNYGPPGQNQGYYGQQNGVELQSPQPTYAREGGDNVYAPPSGPPPGKGNDGIIR